MVTLAKTGPVATTLDDGIGRVVLDAPPLNVLDRAVMLELRERLDGLADEPTLRVLLLGAAGDHFSAGASVEEHLPPEHETMIPEFADTVRALLEFPLPVIAAVRGRCLGGGFELVQAADLVLAGESARFGQPEIRLGVFPPAACALLPALAGRARAAEMIFTGDLLDAREAAEAGVVRRVVPDEDLDEEADALARRVARHSGAALRAAKRALGASRPGSDEALRAAARVYVADLMATDDAVEGLTAFLEKRTPEWSHR